MGDDYSKTFAAQYDAGKSGLVWRRIVADLETPIGTYLKLAQGRTHSFLLESVQDGTTRGRYSIIGLLPDLLLKVEDGKALINRSAQPAPDAFEPLPGLPLDALRDLVAESQIDMPSVLPPQSAGVARPGWLARTTSPSRMASAGRASVKPPPRPRTVTMNPPRASRCTTFIR